MRHNTASPKCRRISCRRTAATGVHPSVEELEARFLPAVFTWNYQPNEPTTLSDKLNWLVAGKQADRAPGNGDSLVFDNHSQVACTIDTSITVGGFTVAPTHTGSVQVALGSTLIIQGKGELDNGSLTGDGSVNIQAHPFTWAGGKIAGRDAQGRIDMMPFSVNGGTMMINGDAGTELGAPLLLDAVHFTNNGTVQWSGAADIDLANGAYIDNNSSFSMTVTGALDATTSPKSTFHNGTNGHIVVSPGAGSTVDFRIFLYNQGPTQINSGSMQLSAASQSACAYTIAANASLVFAGIAPRGLPGPLHSLTDKSTIRGAGTAVLRGTRASLVASGNVLVDNLAFNSGSSQLGVTGNLTIGNRFVWDRGGPIVGAGRILIGPTSQMNISGSASDIYSATVQVNGGKVTWDSTEDLLLHGGAKIQNLGGTFDIKNDQKITGAGQASGTFTNQGIVKKTAGGGISAIDVYDANSGGALQVGTGELDITDTNGGTFVVPINSKVGGLGLKVIGTAVVTGSPVPVEESTLTGTGGIDIANGALLSGGKQLVGDVSNSGTIAIGEGAIIDTIHNAGNYTQAAQGSLTVTLDGYGAGVGYDQMNIDGAANLNGTLNIDLAGFTPKSGDTFVIMTFGSCSGAFGSVTGQVFSSGGSQYQFQLEYHAKDLTLLVVPYNTVPVVTSVSPISGSGGTSVGITGSSFSNASVVLFGGVPATSFTINSGTSITAVAPAHAAGVVDVQVGDAAGLSATGSGDRFTYASPAAPTVTGVSPSLGSTSGNTEVTISGTNFSGVTAVDFGSVASADVSVISPTQIAALAPGEVAGTVDVTVTTVAGTSATSSADHFTYVGPPVVSSLSPASGSTAGGNSVLIRGSNFTGASAVFFGDTSAGSFSVDSDGSITAIAPAQSAGTYDVTVSSASGTSSTSASDQYTYTAAGAPSVTSLSPSTGGSNGGTTVTISGTGFTGATAVDFGSVPASSFAIGGDGQISAVAPANSPGTVNISVVTPSGTSAPGSGNQFTYSAAAAPAITAVSPNSGSTGGGAVVTISGSGFTGASGVTFGGTAATNFAVLADGSIVATAPPHSAATVDVQVTTPSGVSSVTSADHFTYAAAAAPAVSSIAPNTGTSTGGTIITVLGSGFTGATAVNFGSNPAQGYTVVSDTSLTATAPAGSAGTVDVSVTTPSGTSPAVAGDRFTYTVAPVPAVTGVSPSSGSTGGGTLVTVTGSGFTGASDVLFGGVSAASYAATNPNAMLVVNSDTQITVTTPPGSAGTVDVTVVGPGGTSPTNGADPFTYTAASTPAVTGVSPATGTSAGGTAVTITGTNFTGTSAVFFGSTAAAGFTINSDSSITAVSPAEAAGTYDVTVTTPTGTSPSTSADHFTVSAAAGPVVSGLGTSSGSTGGGTSVTIQGSGFTGATAVHFGSVAAGFIVDSDGYITAVSPPQAAGTVDVTVTTYAGTSATSSADRFTYTAAPAPVVTGVAPATGPTPGGTQVVVLGSNFTGATGVTFGSVAAADFTVNSDGSISAISPPEAAGTVNVKVTTYSGTSATSAADQFTYTNVVEPAPAVSGVSPNTGSTAGGQVVTISGSNFSGATEVSFGLTSASSFTILSDSAISAVAPAQSAGTVDVKVTTNNGTSAAVPADQFTYLGTPAPSVTGVSPSTGSTAGGTAVTITGSNFTGATAVAFGGAPATSFTVNSATSISATAPAGPAGTVDVVVTTPSGVSPTSSADQFTYTLAPVPAVTGLGTASGSTAGGTPVTINGTNLGGATGVLFGSVPATSFSVASPTQINAVAPPQAAGTIDVTVSTYGGTSPTTGADRYTYTAAPTPAVSGVSPSTGTTAGGTSVTITGTNFTGAGAVSFGGVAATSYTVNSDTSISATAPPEAAGTVDVTVTTPTGTSASTSADHFTFSAAAAPTVSGVSPSSGSTGGGASVTITGTGFTGATAVSFGTAPATFTVNSDTSLTATSPAAAAGTIDVTVTTYGGTSATSGADKFTYTAAPVPAVTGVAPSSGGTSGGMIVTVTGTGFTGATSVTFGGAAASSFSVLSDSALTALAPPGAAGTVDLQVTTPSGTSAVSAPDRFTYTAGTTPTVSSISPATGGTGGGTSVTITGTGFANTAGVSFGATPATSFVIISGTSIAATAPPSAAGTIDITVSAGSAASAVTSSDRFTYTAASAPAITGVSPTSGTTAGGTVVTVSGTGFTGATAVSFGGVAAAGVTVLSDTSLTATAPPQAAGTVDVTVASPTGVSAVTTADHFTYTAAPVPSVAGVGPASGSTAGGSAVTITGSNFTGATAVTFGGVAASFTVNSAGQITATAPAGLAGTIDITVTTPSGTSATSAADKFTYNAAPLPVVAGVGPSSGTTAGGTLVTVAGSGFTGASSVKFGANAASSFLVVSDGALQAVAPAGTSGTVDITVTTPSGTSATGSADKFNYVAPPVPSVTSLNLGSGTTAGGQVVIVSGTGFTGATGVTFGAYPASSLAINSDTQLTAVVPAEPAGTVDLTVTTPGGTSPTSAADHFTYTAAATPSVTALSPTSGPTAGGTGVAIAGANFTGATAVSFGGTPAASFQVNSDGSIFAVSPAHAAGPLNVTVSTYSGTSTGGMATFTYMAPTPAVTGINPSSGTVGTQVTVTGSGFTWASQVFFGPVAATSFQVASDHTITATAPSPPPLISTVDIQVTTTGGTSNANSADRFTYTQGGRMAVLRLPPGSLPHGAGTPPPVGGPSGPQPPNPSSGFSPAAQAPAANPSQALPEILAVLMEQEALASQELVRKHHPLHHRHPVPVEPTPNSPASHSRARSTSRIHMLTRRTPHELRALDTVFAELFPAGLPEMHA